MTRMIHWLGVPTLSLLLLAPLMSDETTEKTEEQQPTFAEFHIDQLSAERQAKGGPYLPFLNRKTLSCGIYHLKAGAKDGQSPHVQDEVYFVREGKAKLNVDGNDMDAVPGAVLFVAAGAVHHFHSIESDLTLLVFFSAAKP